MSPCTCYTLLVKNLMEEAVALERVKKASDKVWAISGQQAAEKMKPILGESVNIEVFQQTGKIAATVHGIESIEKITENEIQSESVKVLLNPNHSWHNRKEKYE